MVVSHRKMGHKLGGDYRVNRIANLPQIFED